MKSPTVYEFPSKMYLAGGDNHHAIKNPQGINRIISFNLVVNTLPHTHTFSRHEWSQIIRSETSVALALAFSAEKWLSAKPEEKEAKRWNRNWENG